MKAMEVHRMAAGINPDHANATTGLQDAIMALCEAVESLDHKVSIIWDAVNELDKRSAATPAAGQGSKDMSGES